jgi:hypothetical protein
MPAIPKVCEGQHNDQKTVSNVNTVFLAQSSLGLLKLSQTGGGGNQESVVSRDSIIDNGGRL